MSECDDDVVQSSDWPAEYTICVKSCLDPAWSEWLGGVAVEHASGGETLLSGQIEDAPALHSLLTRLYELNLLLIFVRRGSVHWG